MRIRTPPMRCQKIATHGSLIWTVQTQPIQRSYQTLSGTRARKARQRHPTNPIVSSRSRSASHSLPDPDRRRGHSHLARQVPPPSPPPPSPVHPSFRHPRPVPVAPLRPLAADRGPCSSFPTLAVGHCCFNSSSAGVSARAPYSWQAVDSPNLKIGRAAPSACVLSPTTSPTCFQLLLHRTASTKLLVS